MHEHPFVNVLVKYVFKTIVLIGFCINQSNLVLLIYDVTVMADGDEDAEIKTNRKKTNDFSFKMLWNR